jgi:hypothetical protein
VRIEDGESVGGVGGYIERVNYSNKIIPKNSHQFLTSH